jgi:exportin-1
LDRYPRFLKARGKLLETVINKLFKFMHKYTTACKIGRAPHSDRNDGVTVDLTPQQVYTFYEAVGYMISAQPNKPRQEKLTAKVMELPNAAASCRHSIYPSLLILTA